MCDPAIPLLGMYLQKRETLIWKKSTYPHVHSSTISNRQDMESTQMSIIRWMDKDDAMYTYNGILLNHRKKLEKEMATHSSMLAWRIPWTEELGGLQSTGRKESDRLNEFTFTFHLQALEKEMATHSSMLAWRIPGREDPGRLSSMRLHRLGHDWSYLATAAALDVWQIHS